jgi:propionyl-CoA synthetase
MVRLSDPLGGRVVRSWNTPSVSSPMMRCISGDQQHHHHNVVYPPLNLHNIQGEFGSYAHEYKRSIEDPEGFWKDAAKQITWFQEPETILKPRYDNNPHFWDWFPDGTLNTSYNCLDVHVKNGRGDQIALIYDTPLTGGKKERFTYKELLDLVSKMAGALQSLGVTKGNTVIIYMPLIPQAVVAMLACGRIGAVHSVVFGGFGPSEVATRIDDVRPSVVITASCGVEPTRIVPYRPILEKAFQLSSHQVEKVVVVQRPDIEACKLGARDVDYDLLMASAEPVEAVPVQGTDPSYILSTSGSQGKPKGIVRDTAGHAVALKLSMSSFYGLSPGQTMWTASDIGWVVGHSYIVYGPLLYGCSTVLYEGKPVGTPDAGSFWRVVEEYSVKAMFTAPVAFRAIRQADPQAELAKNYDLSSLQSLFLAGEHSDPETLHYLERALPHIPTPIDHWWMVRIVVK